MLQCVAVCSLGSQVAESSKVGCMCVLECVGVLKIMLQCIAVRCSVLQCVAVCCSVMQRIEV